MNGLKILQLLRTIKMTDAPLVLLDTTVFCGALVTPSGFNMRLLKLGATALYRPLISQTVIAEFVHKAMTDGIGKGNAKRLYTPLWIILSKYVTNWPAKAEVSKKLNISIGETDLGDFHIALAVIQYAPEVLITSNTRDLRYLNKLCSVQTPSQFLKSIDALDD
jgi:predicted nucleic acid-binding protein